MKSLNAKISIIVLFSVGITIILTSFCYKNFKLQQKNQFNIQVSLSVHEAMQKLDGAKEFKQHLRNLRQLKKHFKSKDRRLAVSNIVQSYYSNNPKLKKIRWQELREIENKLYTKHLKQYNTLQNTLNLLILSSILVPLIGIVFFSVYVKSSIVKPLQKLSMRMLDFMVDRYTFKFSRPIDNEIGDLQRTFNSLAQKVINNVDELKALDQAKSEFVSIASHELRTPLTSIKGSLGILSSGMMGELNKDSLDLVAIAEQETDRLVRLINDMLDLAKMESNSFAIKQNWVSMTELCTSSLKSLLGLAQAAKVQLKVMTPGYDVLANIDQDRVQQIITNLTSNAIKYSPENSVVKLSLSEQQGLLKVSVTDAGPGISEKDQELIFEKFRQGKESRDKLVKGTGLGLAISKALVEQHGGEIGVESQLGHGCTFYFTLPEIQIKTKEDLNSDKGTQGVAA